ncbi:MAG: polysaccharide pyruvyl transferase CsaB [Clostridia bacterium]
MNRVILSGYYGFDNAGDEAILHSIIAGFKQTIPNIKITVLSANPKRTKELYAVNAINRMNPLTIIREFLRADLFISGGGSLLQDITGKKSIPYYLGLIRLAQIMKIKTVFLSQGVGPVESDLYRKMISKVLKKMNLVVVRDEQSKELLNTLKIGNVEICSDPVFFLQPSSDEEVKGIFIEEKIPFNEKGPWIGVAIRDWTNKDKLIHEVAIGLDKLIATYDAQIVLLPFHKKIDYKVLERIMEEMEANKQTYILKKQYKANELLGMCEKFDLIIGMRLHSLIFAARQRVPFVGISYDIKINSFLEQFQMKPCCSAEDVSSNQIFRLADKILRNQAESIDEIDEKVSEMEQSAWQAIVRVADLLAGRI